MLYAISAFVVSITFVMLLSFAVHGAEPAKHPYDGSWRGAMVCGDEGSDVAFKASRRALVKKSRISLRRGTPERNRFEVWEGAIDPSGVAMIFGRYFWKTEKPLWFKGQVTGRKLNAVGQRGPKTCQLTLVQQLKK